MITASRGERALLVLMDALLVAGALTLAYVLRFAYEVGAVTQIPPAPLGRYAQALVVALVVFHVVLHYARLYERIAARGHDVVEETWRAVTLASLLVLAASFFYRDVSYSRTVTLLGWGLCALVLPIPRLALLGRRRRAYARGARLLPVLLAGSAQRIADLEARLANRRVFGVDVRTRLAVEETPELAAAVEAALGDVREVLLTDGIPRLALLEVLEVCERRGVAARVVPLLYDLFVVPDDLDEVYGVAFISIHERRFELLSRALKRAFDLLVGGALLVLAAPLLAFLAWRIRRESPGPGFFVHTRVGEQGKPFAMWKLRTMVTDAEAKLRELVTLDDLAEPVYKLEDDPRVTPLGKRLRAWSLDELPQLWNVVKGDMSLVGPRPEWEVVVQRYDAHQRRRLKAKPGLTGLQQLEARGVEDLDERIRLDVYYIRRRSFLFDLWLLARTPLAVWRGVGAR
ncbi:MAG: exopolysaccharide biosynthesis polyprenyl glycosylphosphotransferase [Planctomycetes bacterium]|nr:exopolysaccharide biosynthesis polyprenyl glycosylphosphotransferase [Planctomycetota bacterium]